MEQFILVSFCCASGRVLEESFETWFEGRRRRKCLLPKLNEIHLIYALLVSSEDSVIIKFVLHQPSLIQFVWVEKRSINDFKAIDIVGKFNHRELLGEVLIQVFSKVEKFMLFLGIIQKWWEDRTLKLLSGAEETPAKATHGASWLMERPEVSPKQERVHLPSGINVTNEKIPEH